MLARDLHRLGPERLIQIPMLPVSPNLWNELLLSFLWKNKQNEYDASNIGYTPFFVGRVKLIKSYSRIRRTQDEDACRKER